MTRILNPEALLNRAQNLGPLNGLRRLFVDLAPAVDPDHALLDLEFHNDNHVADILDDIQNSGVPPTDIFSIAGGTRLFGGTEPGRVRVTDVAAAAANSLRLRVAPIGDYSTYSLQARYRNAAGEPLIDPMFERLDFKFRPGCFNLNCAPEWETARPPVRKPVIDYLAKDFDSFKHVLVTAMRERVPDWAPTSEADLDQVLIDLIAADADELSDFQDRVMAEAYLASARKRVSLARHARLMDYHIHQGNQAGTWLAVRVASDLSLPAGFGVWTGEAWDVAGAVIFLTGQAQDCLAHLNELELYTWGETVTALEAGATEVDLALPPPLVAGARVDADRLRDQLRRADIRHLLIEEKRNPETGTVNGRDKTARQRLTLLEGDDAAESIFDPLAGEWLVRVRWRKDDALERRYCFLTRCPGQPVTTGVSAFHGNLVFASQGRPYRTRFHPPGTDLAPTDTSQLRYTDEAHYEFTPWGVLCTLPSGPLAYRDTPPGGERPTRSTLEITVGGFATPWQERSDLIESDAAAEHFLVETDEHAISRVRFGNDVNGWALPQDAVVTGEYQIGRGSQGNVGPDTLTGFDPAAAAVTAVWNPFDVTDGRDPEPVAEILRRVPLAYRGRQLRAVTLEDYARRAEELPGVAHARAQYAWTGSWRTVRVALDPRGTTELAESLRREVADYLDAVRLIGEDLEVRAARLAPLDILLRACVHIDYWPEDLAAELEQAFSEGYAPDGRRGFFHPDAWTFGQPLYASQLIGRALQVPGVERVLLVSMRRWNARSGPTGTTVTLDPEDLPELAVSRIEVEPGEIIRVANDPSRLDHGRIRFDILGGRR
jgi:hypothetical protein